MRINRRFAGDMAAGAPGWAPYREYVSPYNDRAQLGGTEVVVDDVCELGGDWGAGLSGYGHLGDVASGAATGATVGSVIPGVGTAAGTVIGAIAGFFGGGKAGIPQAQSVVTKWYVWYLGRKPDADGLHHWINEINANQSFGPSWTNFTGAEESKRVGALQTAQQYEAYGWGGPFDDPGYDKSQIAPPLVPNPGPVPTAPSSSPVQHPVYGPTGTTSPSVVYPTGAVAPPGTIVPGTKLPGAPMSTNMKTALIVGGLVLVGGGIYLATRPRRGR